MMRRRTAHLMRSARFLGRRAKQLIMVMSDVIAMPAALWTAFLLHAGSFGSDFTRQSLAVRSPPSCSRSRYSCGLACIARSSASSAFTPRSPSRSASAFRPISLLLINQFVIESPVPVAVFAIYFALAVLYVGASRFGARELLRMGNVAARPVGIYGAGSAGAQLCTSLSTSPHFRPLAFVDDNKKFHGARVCGLQVHSPDKLLELRRTPWSRAGVPRAAQRLATPAQRNHRKADRAGIQGSDRSRHQRNRLRPGAPRRDPRHRRARSAGSRSGSAEPGAAERLYPRQVHPGHRRRRFHRLRAVPPDHGAVAAAAGAARSVRARALRDRTRAALAECAHRQSHRAGRAAGQRAPQASRARDHDHVRRSRPCITRRRTNTCRSSNTT